MLILGITAALVSHLHFTIPGIEGGVSDAREIVALTSVVFFPNWLYALGVGLLAALGGPFGNALIPTFVMHAFAIPVAWFFLNWLKRHVQNYVLFTLAWIVFIVFLYVLVYSPLFVLTNYFTGVIKSPQLLQTYRLFFAGVKLEALITAVISALLVSFVQMQKRIWEDSLQLNLATEGAGLGLWDWHIISDKKTYNDLWARMLGYSLKEINPKRHIWEKLVHPDDLPSVQSTLQNHLQGKSTFFEAEYRLKTKDGSYKWVLDRGRIVERDILGKPVRMSGTHQDITPRKLQEIEAKKLQAQLLQSQKMEAVGTLAGGVAHDFNNLLTVINGRAELAQMKMGKNELPVHDVQAIMEAGKKAENLTRQLLAFSRKQIYEPRPISLNQVIVNMDKLLRRLIGEDISIETILEENLPSIKADASQIEQILMNLVINARDAINQKTVRASEKKITIETLSKELGDAYVNSHLGCQSGMHVALAVSDTGVGMDEKTQKRVFEPFFTTKEQGKGTGLGLSMIYGVVKQNRGCIYVYSEPGEGTTIKINWPVSGKVSEISAPAAVPEILPAGEATILLVEDDADVRSFAASALSELGYAVHTANNGQQALQLFHDKIADIDLVVTDMVMPEMNGKEMAEKIWQLAPAVKVLFTSGHTDNHIVHNGSLEKGVQFLSKPYSIHALAHKIREVLAE